MKSLEEHFVFSLWNLIDIGILNWYPMGWILCHFLLHWFFFFVYWLKKTAYYENDCSVQCILWVCSIDSDLIAPPHAYWCCYKEYEVLSQPLMQYISPYVAAESLEINLCSLILKHWHQRLTFTLDVLDCWFSSILLRCNYTKNIPNVADNFTFSDSSKTNGKWCSLSCDSPDGGRWREELWWNLRGCEDLIVR